MTEHDEQIMLVKWLNLKKIFHFAIVNENQQSKGNKLAAIKIAQKHKKAGRVKGVSDIIVMLPNKILFIELKQAKKLLKSGKLSISHTNVSDEQKKFLQTIIDNFAYADAMVCYGFFEAKEFIESHI